MSEWKVENIAALANGKKAKNISQAALYPIYGGNGIMGYTNSYNASNVVIIGRVGAYCGSVHYSKEKCWISDNAISAMAKDNNSTEYLYYLLTSLNLNRHHIGGAQPLMTQGIINNIDIPKHSNSEQKKIADILTSLDEKIETNRKINTRLEELAQVIFKSWFIDFEPFGGKMPADWELNSLSGIANYLNGLAMQKYPPINNHDKLPVLKIKELGEGRINDNSDFCSKANIGSDYIIENGDIIFSWSGTLLVKIWTGGKCGLNQHLFKVTSNQYPKWFYYFWTLHHNEEFKRIAKDKAVTMGHIKREELDKALVSVPQLDILHRISSIMDPIFNQLISTNLESARLSALRDTLLPKLMSSELIPE